MEREAVVVALRRELDEVRDGLRRVVEPLEAPVDPAPAAAGIAPLLRELISTYAATGLPPAYVPLPAEKEESEP